MTNKSPLDGPTFYDDDEVFEIYMRHRRHKTDSPNEALEKPVILELAGELAGKRILDLGCGDASFGSDAIKANCRSYLGIDGSQNMVASATTQLHGTQGKVELGNIETWAYPIAAFDLIVARLSLHYVRNLPTVVAQLYDALADGGRFVFSVEHPVITSCARGWSVDTPRQDWLVDDYFVTGERVTSWLGGTIIKYHRTVEDYYAILNDARFTITGLREATPVREHFSEEKNFRRRQRIPLFLIMSASK